MSSTRLAHSPATAFLATSTRRSPPFRAFATGVDQDGFTSPRPSHDVEESPPPPPSSARPHNQPTVVDRAMEFAVERLAHVLQAKSPSNDAMLEDTGDTRQLLDDISQQVAKILNEKNGGSDKDNHDSGDEDDWNFPSAGRDDRTSSEDRSSARPTPYDVWSRRKVKRSEPLSTPERKQPPKLSEEQWEDLVHRLNDSLRRHNIQVAATQQALIAKELSGVTFTPRINERSRDLASGEISIVERTVFIEEQRKRRLQLEKKRLQEKEISQATFQPRINEHSRTLAASTGSRLFDSPRERREIMAKKVMDEREADEKTKYSFSPVINPKSREMVSKGKALQMAFSPTKSVASPRRTSEESFKPTINPMSRRLAASHSSSKPVHERLYEEGLEMARRAREKEDTEHHIKTRKAPVIVMYKPDMDFILETLGKDFR